jgi:hypothetical protein
MLYGSQRPSCYRQEWATQTVHALTPTRNKPSFTPDAAEGGTRVRPILVPVSPWSRRMCVPWNRAGARSKRHLLQTLIPQPSAVGATSITSSDRSRDRSASRDRSRSPRPVQCLDANPQQAQFHAPTQRRAGPEIVERAFLWVCLILSLAYLQVLEQRLGCPFLWIVLEFVLSKFLG